MSEHDQIRLGKTLWAIADQLRGAWRWDGKQVVQPAFTWEAVKVAGHFGSQGKGHRVARNGMQPAPIPAGGGADPTSVGTPSLRAS